MVLGVGGATYVGAPAMIFFACGSPRQISCPGLRTSASEEYHRRRTGICGSSHSQYHVLSNFSKHTKYQHSIFNIFRIKNWRKIEHLLAQQSRNSLNLSQTPVLLSHGIFNRKSTMLHSDCQKKVLSKLYFDILTKQEKNPLN